jgi:uncharacterized delta-60 repeat protein
MKRLLLVLTGLLLSISSLQAQNPGELDLTFNAEGVNYGVGADGTVRTTALQPDGKILIGGDFFFYNGISRDRIARLNSDGSLDTSFNPGTGANTWVTTIALQPDGKILIGGNFTSYNGTTRNRIARLNSDGSLDTSFNPGTGANNTVWTIALQPEGKILVGGAFTSYNGTPRNYITRLNSDGSLDTSFNPGTGTNDTVYTIALQPDGKILIGGQFTFYNGASTNRIARLNADGSLDTSFNSGTGANSTVWTIALQPDGKILLGGYFTSYNGTPVNYIFRVNTDGSLDTSFNPGTGASSQVWTIALQADGKILIGGNFTSYNGTSSHFIARLNADGSLDTSFNPGTGASNPVDTITFQSDGKILIGGYFTYYNGSWRNNIARLNADGSPDTSFNPSTGPSGPVHTLAIQPNGKIVIGGDFGSYNGTSRGNIARLNTDGSLDATFNPGAGASHIVLTTALQSDGKILIGGQFVTFNGTQRSGIARLNADGSLDTSFSNIWGANNAVWTTALQPDGKILIGGEFTSYIGTPRSKIARLNADGSLDISFNPGSGANDYVVSMALQPDGKILIGGFFNSYNGTSRNGIARLNADGSLDTSFNPGTGASTYVLTTALQPDGKILIGGAFTSYNGITRNRIARLNSDGSLDTSFILGSGANNHVRTITLQPDGKILIGGEMVLYNGISRSHIARLNADGSLDTSFDPGTGANNGRVWTIALQTDGKILLGGDFTGYNGVSRARIARIFGRVDVVAPAPDVEPLLTINAQCLVNFEDLTIPTATDIVDGTIQGTTDQSIFPITTQGTTTIIWNYSDEVGNTSFQTQDIVILDTELPVTQAGPNVQLEAEENSCQASVSIPLATASDNCPVGNPTGVRNDNLPLTDPYPVGETTITWNVTDINGNPAIEVIQTIKVTDTQVPVISTNGDQNVNAESGLCSATVTVSASANDNCTVDDPTGLRSDNLPLTDPYPVGETTITWNVTDVNGNPAIEVIQIIKVTDDQSPEVQVKNYSLQLDNTGNGVLMLGDIDNGSFDTCTIVTRVLSKTNFNCSNVGSNTVTLTVTDAAGNSASATATVNVLTPIIPISVNINSTVAPNGNNNVVIFDGAAASLNLPSSTILSAAGIPSSYTGLTYKWYWRDNPSGSFQSSPIETSPSIVVNASDDFTREYKLMVFSNSGCIAEKTISVISVEASCGNAGQNKVALCQLSPNGKRNTICVSPNAVNAILTGSPGSFVGSCNITYRLDEEPELITVPWNTPLEVIKEKIASQSVNWFDRKKINLSISANSYNPLASGLYEVKVDLEENEWYMLEEPISVKVLVLDKPQALDISISNDKLAKDVRSGQVIGNLSTIDPADDMHTYSMEVHPDLDIQGNQLIWKGTNIPDVQMKVTVFSTDRAGQTISKEIRLSRELKPGDFFLYPNPAVNETNVMLNLDQPATVAFEVYDAIGRLVIQDEADKEGSFTHILKLEGLAPGLYTVQLKVGNRIMTKRLIKN